MRGETLKNHSKGIDKGMTLPGAAKSPDAAISRRLKALYDAVEQEEIPDRFLELLERLDAAETASRREAEG